MMLPASYDPPWWRILQGGSQVFLEVWVRDFACFLKAKRRGKCRLRRKNSEEFQSKAIARAVADDAGDP
jgi:hypothetical protein